MAAGPIAERNQDATIYVGGLDEKVSETLLWELFLEAGPVGWFILEISKLLFLIITCPFVYPHLYFKACDLLWPMIYFPQ